MATAQMDTQGRPPLPMVLATNVYRLRVMKVPKWSQERLAQEADLAINTVALVEAPRDPSKQQSMARLDTIDRLARALDVEPSELLHWEEATRAFLHGSIPHLGPMASPTVTPKAA